MKQKNEHPNEVGRFGGHVACPNNLVHWYIFNKIYGRRPGGRDSSKSSHVHMVYIHIYVWANPA